MFKLSVESSLGQTNIKTWKFVKNIIRNIFISSIFSQTLQEILINWIFPVYFNVLTIGLMLTLTEDWVSDPANDLRGMEYCLVDFWVIWQVNFQICVRKRSCRQSTLSTLDSTGRVKSQIPNNDRSDRAGIPTHCLKYSKQICQPLCRLFWANQSPDRKCF